MAQSSYHSCIGVYVIDGRTAGAYARVAPRALIDGRAQDAAVLLDRSLDSSFDSSRHSSREFSRHCSLKLSHEEGFQHASP